MSDNTPIGIDLGTTMSVVAYVDGPNSVKLVKTEDGDTRTPSVIFFTESGDTIVGQMAVMDTVTDPQNSASLFKSEMGSEYYRPEFYGVAYSAEQLSAILLGRLRAEAERELGSLGPAVVTVPAYFNNAQREATMNAARAAGLDVKQTINEPTAAAIAYGQQHPDLEGKIVVYDLGGGTFDVTLLDYTLETTRVIASDGDHHLGGAQWDERLVEYIANKFVDEHGEDPLSDPECVAEIRIKSEEAKKALSTRSSTKISISYAGKRFTVDLTREEFEGLTSDLIEQTKTLLERMLDAAGLDWPEVDAILLIGGSTRMPAVPELIRELFKKEPLSDINPHEAVAIGAAFHASTLAAPVLGLPPLTRKTIDVTPHSLGYVAISPDGTRFINDFVIRKNLPIPALYSRKATLDTHPGYDNVLDVYLLQGESDRVLDNEVLGHYKATGIPHTTGKAVLEVEYSYDISGIVHIACRETQTGADLAITRQEGAVDLSWTDGSPQEYAASQGGGGIGPVNAFLLIDTSGSMHGVGIREAIKAAKEFLARINPQMVRVGLGSFGSCGGSVVERITPDRKKIETAVSGLSTGGGTPLTGGLKAAGGELDRAKGNRVLIVLTDGYPNSPPGALNEADRIKKRGIRIIAIGTGSANHEYLKKLASPGDTRMVDFSDLATTFGSIAQSLAQGSGMAQF